MTKARGRVHGNTIMVSPAAKLKRNHPNVPDGSVGARKKSHNKPKTIAAKSPSETKIRIVRNFPELADPAGPTVVLVSCSVLCISFISFGELL